MGEWLGSSVLLVIGWMREYAVGTEVDSKMLKIW